VIHVEALSVTSSTRPFNPKPGTYVFEVDTRRLMRWDGTCWNIDTVTHLVGRNYDTATVILP